MTAHHLDNSGLTNFEFPMRALGRANGNTLTEWRSNLDQQIISHTERTKDSDDLGLLLLECKGSQAVLAERVASILKERSDEKLLFLIKNKIVSCRSFPNLVSQLLSNHMRICLLGCVVHNRRHLSDSDIYLLLLFFMEENEMISLLKCIKIDDPVLKNVFDHSSSANHAHIRFSSFLIDNAFDAAYTSLISAPFNSDIMRNYIKETPIQSLSCFFPKLVTLVEMLFGKDQVLAEDGPSSASPPSRCVDSYADGPLLVTNVIQWICCILDASFPRLIINDEFIPYLIKLKKVITSHMSTLSRLTPLYALLSNLSENNKFCPPAENLSVSYQVQHLQWENLAS